MRNRTGVAILMMALMLTSCEAIGDIFSAGFYTGLILVVIVAILILFVVRRTRRK